MSRFDPERHHRRSIRLPGYDYNQPGAYFVTVCIRDRICLLGKVVGEVTQLSDAGRLVHQEWFRTAAIRDNVMLKPDEFVVMPNHIHGIIHIIDRRGEGPPRPENSGVPRPVTTSMMMGTAATPHGAAVGSLGSMIGQFKSVTTKAIHAARHSPGSPVWQRGFYEHVVRDDADLERIQRYIAENPSRWAEDSEYIDP